MAKGDLIKSMAADPVRHFRVPVNVLRDRRLTTVERISILDAWAQSPGEFAEQIEMVKEELR